MYRKVEGDSTFQKTSPVYPALHMNIKKGIRSKYNLHFFVGHNSLDSYEGADEEYPVVWTTTKLPQMGEREEVNGHHFLIAQ